MPITAEKSPEADLEHDAIERYLREEVVKIYDAVKADPSICIPMDQAFADIKAALKEKFGD